MKQFYCLLTVFFIAFFINLPPLYPQELPEDIYNENYINAISVSGLKRTKSHIIEKLLQKFIGRPVENIDINEVIAILKSSGIVEPLSVEIIDNQDGGGKTLVIIVQEKWSIFLIPIFSANSTGWSAGGAIMDVNAFGVKDNMMIMGGGGTSGWIANIIYVNTPDEVGDFGWNLMGNFFFQNREITDQKEEVIRRFNSLSIRSSAGITYALSEKVTPNINISYQDITLRDTQDPINAPEKGMRGISISPGIDIKHSTWDGYFLNVKSAALKYVHTIGIDVDDINSVSFNGVLNHSIVEGFRFTAKSGIIFATKSASPFFESSSMNAAVNILPQKYSATDFAGISLGVEKYLLKLPLGTVSLSTAYQMVYSNGELLRRQFDYGAVVMLQMYFSKIAIPGMGLGLAYNMDKGVWQYAFNIGMMF
jgi:hypothetical protein